MFDHSFPAGDSFLLLLLLLLLLFLVEISSRTLVPLFTPRSVHRGSAS